MERLSSGLRINSAADGIRVVVHVQKRQGGVWSDHGTDNEMGLQLEELILTRARKIRAVTVNETQ